MFKEGDKIRLINNCSGAIANEIYTLTYGTKQKNNLKNLVAWKDGKTTSTGSGCSCQKNWELVLTAKELNKINLC